MLSTRELVHAAVEEIWNRGKLDLADSLFTDDYVNHGGLVPDLVCGPEAIKLSAAMFRQAFPTLRIAIDDLSSDGSAMVLRWVANCTPRRVDMPAKRGLRGITRCRLHNGKIAETWTVWDSRTGVVGLGTLRQKLSRG